MGQVSKDPSVGKVKFKVTTTWKGTTKSETVVQGYEIGGQKVKRIHEQYEEVHKTVVATSPNYYNISRAIELNTELIFE